MRERLDSMMQSFKADDYTVKLVSGVCSVVPFAPKFFFYNGLEDAVRAVIPNATSAQIERARQLSADESVENALWVADALNTGSKGIAMYTGLKSAFNMFFASAGKSETVIRTFFAPSRTSNVRRLNCASSAAVQPLGSSNFGAATLRARGAGR